LRQHDRSVGGDVDDAELNAFDAGRAGTDERRDVVGNVLSAGDRLERNVVVHGVVGEERREIFGAEVVAPRSAKPAYEVDGLLHPFPPPFVFAALDTASAAVVSSNLPPTPSSSRRRWASAASDIGSDRCDRSWSSPLVSSSMPMSMASGAPS